MKVYVLRHEEWNWDDCIAMAIVAKDESEARLVANCNHGREGPIWQDREKVTCQIISEGIALQAYMSS